MIVDLKQNGFGLRYGASFEDVPAPVHDPWFDSYSDVIDEVFADGAIVLSGEPGAGKSHITQDVLYGSYTAGKAVCMISCHINSGSQVGRQVTQETFDTAAELGNDCLVVVDNLDYLVYTGAVKRRRTNAKVEAYADFITGNLSNLREEGCAVFATVHTELWRDNHSSAPDSVRELYDATVESLGGEKVFTGDISEDNAARLLRRRLIVPDVASSIASDLASVNALHFRQAHHISVDTFLAKGIEEAAAEVEAVKQKKIAGGM